MSSFLTLTPATTPASSPFFLGPQSVYPQVTPSPFYYGGSPLTSPSTVVSPAGFSPALLPASPLFSPSSLATQASWSAPALLSSGGLPASQSVFSSAPVRSAFEKPLVPFGGAVSAEATLDNAPLFKLLKSKIELYELALGWLDMAPQLEGKLGSSATGLGWISRLVGGQDWMTGLLTQAAEVRNICRQVLANKIARKKQIYSIYHREAVHQIEQDPSFLELYRKGYKPRLAHNSESWQELQKIKMDALEDKMTLYKFWGARLQERMAAGALEKYPPAARSWMAKLLEQEQKAYELKGKILAAERELMMNRAEEEEE